MKDFFKRYGYDSMKMFIDQIAIAMFGFALAMTAAHAKSDTLLLWASIGSIVFYLALIFGVARKVGSHDKTSIDLNTRTFRPFTGTLIALVANIPNLVLAVAVTIIRFTSPDGGSGVPRAIALLIQGMYQGLLAAIPVGAVGEKTLYLNSCWWVYFLITLPAILIATLGYIAGAKGWHLTGFSPADLPASDRPTRKEMKARRQETKEKK